MTVSFERDGAVAVISLDDGKANALSPDVLGALSDAFDKAEADGASAVLLQQFAAGNVYGEYLNDGLAVLDAIDLANDARSGGNTAEVWHRETKARLY